MAVFLAIVFQAQHSGRPSRERCHISGAPFATSPTREQHSLRRYQDSPEGQSYGVLSYACDKRISSLMAAAVTQSIAQ